MMQSHAQKEQRDKESGQHGLFGVFQQEETHPPEVKLPDTPDWDEHTRLGNEKEILGFFITGHPLEKYREKLEDLRALSVGELCTMAWPFADPAPVMLRLPVGRDPDVSGGSLDVGWDFQ